VKNRWSGKILGVPWLHHRVVSRAAGLLLAWGASGTPSAASTPAATAQIPALRWEERSDWINVKTDALPAAVGDGQADDTAAIQRALAALRDGSVLYFPPGTYRITAPLTLRKRHRSTVDRRVDRRAAAATRSGCGTAPTAGRCCS
jgi:hypothetical protein